MFDELVEEVTKRIEATEGRERSRRQGAVVAPENGSHVG